MKFSRQNFLISLFDFQKKKKNSWKRNKKPVLMVCKAVRIAHLDFEAVASVASAVTAVHSGARAAQWPGVASSKAGGVGVRGVRGGARW